MTDWRAYVRRHLPALDIPPEREIEIVEELALQLEAAYESAIARGASDAEARASAIAEVPDWSTLACTLRRIERRRTPSPPIGSPAGGLLVGIIEDVRYGVRALRRSPAFALATIGTLALGIAAATIVYSLVDGILLRPLPIQDPDRVVLAREVTTRGDEMSVSWPNFIDWQARATSFESLAAWRGFPANLTSAGSPRRIMVRQVTWNLFSVLGVKPAFGRDLTPADEQFGVERVCLVSYAFWQRELGSDAGAVGRRLSLDETPVTVVGVLPPGFSIARQEDLFLPFGNFYPANHPMLERGNHSGLAAIGRLRAGSTVDAARADLSLIARQLATEHPNTNTGNGATANYLTEVLVGPVRTTLMILLGAVGALLVIGCANIANLLLVRGAMRGQELEVRIALGAGRWRIVRQLLVESALLSVVGGAVGVGLAFVGFDAAISFIPENQPRLHAVSLNPRVLAVSAALSLATGLLFGLIPALETSGRGASALLRSARVTGGASGRHRTRRTLLASELAVAVVVLAGAGLMVRTVANLLAVDLGFQPDQVLTARVSLPGARYQPEARRDFMTRVEERLRAIPGVAHAAFTNSLPVEGSNWNSVFIVEHQPVPPRAELPSAAWTPITPAYFDAMRIRLLRGRAFQTTDGPDAPRTVVVNETFAARFWPKDDAIGHRIKQGWPESDTPWREIVGIVEDVKIGGLNSPPALQAYAPLAQMTQIALAVVVRAQADREPLARALEAAIHDIDPALPVYDVRSMEDVIDQGMAQQRLLAWLLVGFGAVSLGLAALGVFGVTAYSVSQRTHELGVRMALGADRQGVLRLVLVQGLGTCAVGIGVGLTVTLSATTVLKSLLYGISPYDPTTLGTITSILVLVTTIACYVPARRATQIDPVTALRAE